MAEKMSSIATKTGQHVSEVYPSGNAHALKELFTAVIQQMRQIVYAHSVLLDSVRDAVKDEPHSNDLTLYTEQDVWSQVQSVVGNQVGG